MNEENQELDQRARSLREQAEKIARKRTGPLPEAIEKMTYDEIRKILHELRVHQIQLEMQNEELREIQAALEIAHERYFDLYDLAPVGYCTLNENSLILETNLAAAGLVEMSRERLTGQPFTRFILKDDQDIFYLQWQRLLEIAETQVCDLRMIKKDGAVFWAHLSATAATDTDGDPICRVVITDITEQKNAEINLQYLNMHDVLTGLYNRAYFEESLQRLEKGRQYPVTILMADMDNLKTINDQYGHEAGDTLLKRAAHLLTISFRADDVIARIGGDEFAILMPSTPALAAADSLKRFRSFLKEHNAAYSDIPVQLSCGISTAVHPKPLIDVLKQADTQMYLEKEKRNGKPRR